MVNNMRKAKQYFNKRVIPRSFKLGDLVLKQEMHDHPRRRKFRAVVGKVIRGDLALIVSKMTKAGNSPTS